jgi:uncharacterized protein YcbK (DUF882 family)
MVAGDDRCGLERNPGIRQERLKKIDASHGSKTPRGNAPGSMASRADTTPPSAGVTPSSKVRRMVGALVGAVATLVVATAAPAHAENRTLDLYNTHTRERLTITFKKNGRYVPSALAELNRFLRDWRRNESIKMDPRLFDTVWEVYKQTGSGQPIHVVSAYRSLATNDRLRSRSRAVAKHSQHTLGKAMDLFIPGVSVNRVREIGMRMQRGGVGWYPSANSPFVHIDVGSVRAWPRMTRSQLVKLFPDGKTVHLPADGKPLPGYQQALAELKRNGGSRPLALAADEGAPAKRGGLLAMLFGDEEDETEEVNAAKPTTSGQSVTASRPVKPAPSTATAVRTEPVQAAPATPPPGLGPIDPPPTVVALVPKPVPAPARPEPVVTAEPAVTTLADATLPPGAPPADAIVPASGEAAPAAPVETALAVVPLPPSRPDALVPAPALEVAALEVPLPPRARAELRPADDPLVALAAPAVPAAAAAPLPQAEPANAQLALAEVAGDTTLAGPPDVLGYASATALPPRPETPRKPVLRTASLTAPAAARGLGTGQADPLAALAPPSGGDKTDPAMAEAALVPAASDLPIYDGAQSAYWGVFAQFVHPDQRRAGTLFAEPVKVIVSGFGSTPYGDLKATRFTGEALPRLQVMRFTTSGDLAMR